MEPQRHGEHGVISDVVSEISLPLARGIALARFVRAAFGLRVLGASVVPFELEDLG